VKDMIASDYHFAHSRSNRQNDSSAPADSPEAKRILPKKCHCEEADETDVAILHFDLNKNWVALRTLS